MIFAPSSACLASLSALRSSVGRGGQDPGGLQRALTFKVYHPHRLIAPLTIFVAKMPAACCKT